jgi:hypothetical protein
MLSSILILSVLPFCNRLIKNSELSGGTKVDNHIFFYLFSVSIIMLGIIGGLPAEFPYIQFGKFFTFIYFSSYLINLLSSKLENKITTQMLGVRSYIGVNI